MTTYDRIDWHTDRNVEAGQPANHGATHIGLYLAWLIRRDLHDPATFPSEHVDAVKAGEMTGWDLMDDIDGTLVGDVMSPEGKAFSDARYEAFLGEYAAMFDSLPDYGVEDGPQAYDDVERLLDRMYGDWVEGGRQSRTQRSDPAASDDEFAATSSIVMLPPGMSQAAIDELLADLPADAQVMSADGTGTRSHDAPELEWMIPRDLTNPPMDVISRSAARWGSSLLTRALKRLGVSPGAAVVVRGLGGDGNGTLTVTLYGVPGIDEDRLTTEFRSVIFRPPGSSWETLTVAGREVEWASGEEFTVAFWARDGMVIHVTGQPEVASSAIARLP